MFPENDLAAEFWLFVRDRAMDVRQGIDEIGGAATLNSVEHRRNVVRGLSRHDLGETDDRTNYNWELGPQIYATIQDALLAFLVNHMAQDRFVYNYATWLRTVAAILGDAVREPDWLTVIVPETKATADSIEEGAPAGEHQMTVSDSNWDCLNRETFHLIRKQYQGAEARHPQAE
jgi:hypothetical protein